MIDTHCHLTDTRLRSQLSDVLARAHRANVNRLITISTDLEDARQCVAVCQNRGQIRAAVGIHPSYVDESDPNDVLALREIALDPAVVAVGEIGLDYYRGKDNRQRQTDFFVAQLNLAKALGKPMVIHCREAIDDCLSILQDFASIPAVFHCFTGTVPEARRILEAGYLLGFTGVITFKPSEGLREVVKLTPMERMLVETDAPYLTPEPMRKQKVNEPAMVPHTAAKVAELKGLSVEEVDDITTRNAETLFAWVTS